jgi:transcription elongation factor Elf1
MNLRQIFKYIFICKTSKHEYTTSASCPFTLKTYWYCKDCNHRKVVPTSVGV